MIQEPVGLVNKLHDSHQKIYKGLSNFKTFGKGCTRWKQQMREQAHTMLEN